MPNPTVSRGLFGRLVSIGGFLVAPAPRGRWKVIEPDGSTLAVRDSYKRAVLRAWRAAADGPAWRAFL